MREKRETFAINIRKQKREEVFKLKRFIDVHGFDSIYNESLSNDPQRLSNILINTINDVRTLCEQMPNTTTQITSRVRKIRNLLKLDPKRVTTTILQMDFIGFIILIIYFRILAAFLKPEFDSLMEEAGWTLCAFMVLYDHSDFSFWNDYNI